MNLFAIFVWLVSIQRLTYMPIDFTKLEFFKDLRIFFQTWFLKVYLFLILTIKGLSFFYINNMSYSKIHYHY